MNCCRTHRYSTTKEALVGKVSDIDAAYKASAVNCGKYNIRECRGHSRGARELLTVKKASPQGGVFCRPQEQQETRGSWLVTGRVRPIRKCYQGRIPVNWLRHNSLTATARVNGKSMQNRGHRVHVFHNKKRHCSCREPAGELISSANILISLRSRTANIEIWRWAVCVINIWQQSNVCEIVCLWNHKDKWK